jgi:dienelactone hydrolase
MPVLRALLLLAAAFAALAPRVWGQSANRIVYTVAPDEADPSVTHFLRSSVVVFDRAGSPQAPLLVFLPGTTGDPARVQLFLGKAADSGYRVISLSYDNDPAVMQACAHDPDPVCPERFRQSRLFGGFNTPPEEAIVGRLTKLLQRLDRNQPGEGWGAYLANGVPDWRRIAVAGHSQGGGMAALLAKRVPLARVLLFSGPPDFVPPDRAPAPWLATPSATPNDRWFGLYHGNEPLAPLLQRAYAALGLAPDHIRVVSLAPAGPAAGRFDAYHVSVVADRLTPRLPDGSPAYAGDWAFLLGAGH